MTQNILKFLYRELNNINSECSFYDPEDINVVFAGFIYIREAPFDFLGDQLIFRFILRGHEESFQKEPVYYIKNKYFILEIKDKKIKFEIDEVSADASPSRFIVNKTNLVEFECYLFINDFIIENKIENYEVVERFEILDL